MRCPFCNSDTIIYNSRGNTSGTQTWRRHRCKECGLAFTTRERIDWDGKVLVAGSDGSTSAYSKERLLLSLLKASMQDKSSSSIITLADNIEDTLQRQHFFNSATAQSSTITEVVITTLRSYDRGLALQYLTNVYHSNPPAKLLRQLID